MLECKDTIQVQVLKEREPFCTPGCTIKAKTPWYPYWCPQYLATLFNQAKPD